ncbi:MAG: hypothetical protein EBU90_16220 [Proteobacteria bacterium]|nr:hypothetical protein [Pseudomonadota bacterium]
MKKPPVNLTPLQKDYAVFLPAISSFYSTYVAKQRLEEFVPKDRIPAGFDRGIEGMNFLNPEEGYFTYKYALYSAGHAQLDLQKSLVQESMIQQRDRNATMILGDSGGYQIGKGVIKFDWQDFEGPKANAVRQQILEWLEVTADWSMMLDVPTWACDHIHSPKTGLKTVEDCLEKTRFNNEYFLKNRLGQTKFLNVLQGWDWESAEDWYNGVKEFSDPAVWGDKAAEGWAFGGANMCKMHITLKRLMTMREDGLLTNKNWIHFLGTAQLDWSCYLTSIQRQIRKHINEEITISFDCASPFIATAHGLVYTNAQHTTKRWSVIMDKAPDNKALAGSDIPFAFESEIGRRMTMGDICHYAPGMLNKIKKEGKTSWDSFSYALMMGHNVYCHIVAVQRAQQLMDIEVSKSKGKVDWRQWRKLNQREAGSDEYSEWVPRNVLYFNNFVEDLFSTKTKQEAFDMIDQASAFLKSLEGARLRGGHAENNFGNLFDIDDVTRADEIDLENPEDENLRDLENQLIGK